MLNPDELSAVKRSRYFKILNVSKTLFAASGFRGVTMEAVAEAAHISKATLYAYFADKDELFSALIQVVAQEVRDAFCSELEQAGPIEERVAGAFLAKFRLMHKLLRSSPYAEELFSAKDRLQGGYLDQLDKELERRLAERLSDQKRALPPALMARVLMASSLGCADQISDPEEVELAVRFTVASLLEVRNT